MASFKIVFDHNFSSEPFYQYIKVLLTKLLITYKFPNGQIIKLISPKLKLLRLIISGINKSYEPHSLDNKSCFKRTRIQSNHDSCNTNSKELSNSLLENI